MLGFLVGAACLVGLVKVARGGCGGYAHEGFGHWHGGWGGHHGWHRGHGRGCDGGGFGHRGGFQERGRWRAPRRMMRFVFERLETSPGQEKVILDAMDSVRGAGEKFRGELGHTREEVSRALRGEHFDVAALRELFSKHDVLLSELRESLVGGLSQVHEALDERQRRALSELIEDAGHFGGGRWA